MTLVERFKGRHPHASHAGSTRLWRLADTQVWRARSILYTLPAMERLSKRLGQPVFNRTGFVWRDDVSLPDVEKALASIAVPYDRVAAAKVGDVFPGLIPDGRDALYLDDGGVVYPDVILGRGVEAFIAAGGTLVTDSRVVRIEPGNVSAKVVCEDGTVFEGDQVLVAAGPGTRELLPGLGVELPLNPYLEQLVFFGDPKASPPAPHLPGLVDCPRGDAPGIYAMPNGSEGYKIGIDKPLRALAGATLGDDLDRTPTDARMHESIERIKRTFSSITPTVLKQQVCTWTDSGDGDFIIGRTHPSVVLACGDSGEGFKYSAYFGEYLADLVTGGDGVPEFQKHWAPTRFSDGAPRDGYGAIGRH